MKKLPIADNLFLAKEVIDAVTANNWIEATPAEAKILEDDTCFGLPPALLVSNGVITHSFYYVNDCIFLELQEEGKDSEYFIAEGYTIDSLL